MGEGFTKCGRCGGMMVYEKMFYGTEHYWTWKCVHCGEYVDRVIWENRLLTRGRRVRNTKSAKG
jgi:hypothetical protein